MLPALLAAMTLSPFTIVDRPPSTGANSFYAPNLSPLQTTPLVKLPVTRFKPGGWLRRSLELQRDGLTGHLGEISVWLTKEGNAWLSQDGQGKYGWEEVPYWLRGYSRVGYALEDQTMIQETQFWIDRTLRSQRPNGDFGPIHNHRKGFRDLWAQMLMLQVLQSWYEFSGDARVVPFMTDYFRWQATIPDAQSSRTTGRTAAEATTLPAFTGFTTGLRMLRFWTLPQRSTEIQQIGVSLVTSRTTTT